MPQRAAITANSMIVQNSISSNRKQNLLTQQNDCSGGSEMVLSSEEFDKRIVSLLQNKNRKWNNTFTKLSNLNI